MKNTHIVVHAYLMQVEPTPIMVRIADIDRVRPIDRKMDLNADKLPEELHSYMRLKGEDTPFPIVEHVYHVQSMIDGCEALFKEACNLLQKFDEALRVNNYPPIGGNDAMEKLDLIKQVQDWLLDDDGDEHALSCLMDRYDFDQQTGNRVWRYVLGIRKRVKAHFQFMGEDYRVELIGGHVDVYKIGPTSEEDQCICFGTWLKGEFCKSEDPIAPAMELQIVTTLKTMEDEDGQDDESTGGS